ncbi:glycosyltransferase family 4 protein [Heyndrickxia acidicola]|uniref:Glycosyltransferase family 4 protein n=1 Tax=Heyndrickxia acidicola TaxID=209389 RepID=A0ABU6MFI8_9BACI|nr:glycosyltransferase family 4 protein [Heyndrickxia acidicola]MED1203453.1 glycosyltransferase family 4 protein [Heyndrickxia acidicola]
MKILLATYWPIPHVGGVWRYMEQLQKKLESLGHEVDLMGYGEDNSHVYLVNKDEKLQDDQLLPLLRAKLTPQTHPEIYANKLVEYTEFHRYVYELSAAYFGLDKYDVIHTQDVISTASIDRVRPKKTALVATLHGSVAHEIRHQLTTIHKSSNSYLARAYFDELEKVGASAAETTIVANQWLKNILTNEFNVPSNLIKVFHYGFDTQSFLKRINEGSPIKRPKDKKVILYSGRLVELKGVHHLINALGNLKKDRSDWVCWIVGSGDHQAELEGQSKALGLDEDVFFFGKRDDVPSLMAKSDIFVLTSLLENQPLAVIEAQMAGLPAIVSDVGGLPEIVKNEVTGIIIPSGDEEALYKNLNQLLDDEQRRKKLGANAKQWAQQHWSLDKEVKNVVDVYKNAINQRGKSNRDDTTDSIH